MTARAKAHAEPILSARGIVNRFGKQLVHDKLDLDVVRGEIIGIAGGSGSGKSVLLKTLVGLHEPESGAVLLNGKAVQSIAAAEKAALIGVLFQQGALFSSLSVAQNIMLPMREHTALPAEEQVQIAAMKLALAGLPADSGIKFPSALSGGMVKRAAFARALALDPKILFLDEPTSDLDPIAASGIDTLIRQLNDSLGITVVIVTHDLTTLFTICGRIAVLVDRKVTVDTAEKLMKSDHPWIHECFHGPRAEGAMKGITGVVFIELSGGDPAATTLLAVTAQEKIPEIPSEKVGLKAMLDELPKVVDKFSAIEDQIKKVVTSVGGVTEKVKADPSLLLRRP